MAINSLALSFLCRVLPTEFSMRGAKVAILGNVFPAALNLGAPAKLTTAAFSRSTVDLVRPGYTQLNMRSIPIIDLYIEDSGTLLAQDTNDISDSDSDEFYSDEFQIDSDVSDEELLLRKAEIKRTKSTKTQRDLAAATLELDAFLRHFNPYHAGPWGAVTEAEHYDDYGGYDSAYAT
ncbi:MAG: hypothetical protein Q9184_008013 [Pyrenodesmia sp. 2 TL-2023]